MNQKYTPCILFAPSIETQYSIALFLQSHCFKTTGFDPKDALEEPFVHVDSFGYTYNLSEQRMIESLNGDNLWSGEYCGADTELFMSICTHSANMVHINDE